MIRTIKFLAVAAAAAAVAGLLPGLSPSAHAESCVPGGSSLTFLDAYGDTPTIRSAPTIAQESSLDILSSTVTWHEVAQKLVFEVQVDDLRELPALGGEGERYDFHFVSNGSAYFLRAVWSRIDQRQAFHLLTDSASPTTLAALTGSFDLDTETIAIEVPPYVVTSAGDTVFQLADGELRGLVVDSLRSNYAVSFFVDQSTTSCTVTVTGADQSPGGSLPSLVALGDTLAFTGTVDAGAVGQCAPTDRVGTGTLCPSSVFEVRTPAGGATLVIALESVTPDDGTADLDLRLSGPNGMNILTSESGNGDSIVVVLPADGSLDGGYTIEVSPYSAVAADFSVSLTLA